MKVCPFGGKWDGGCAQGSFPARQVSTRVPIFFEWSTVGIPTCSLLGWTTGTVHAGNFEDLFDDHLAV